MLKENYLEDGSVWGTGEKGVNELCSAVKLFHWVNRVLGAGGPDSALPTLPTRTHPNPPLS